MSIWGLPQADNLARVAGMEKAKIAATMALNELVKDRPRTDIVRSKNSILLFGPPGTGKTLLALALADKYKLFVMALDVATMGSTFVDGRAINIRNFFRSAREQGPKCIVLLDSPSATEPLSVIGLKIEELSKKGWTHSTELTAAQRRAAFIMIVMDGYLHSIHCGKCGASFLVNKAPNAYFQWRGSYYCPVCDLKGYTKPDDTFFNLMVSPELAKTFQDARKLLDIMGKTDLEVLVYRLRLLDSLPKEAYKALSEGHRIEKNKWMKALDGTN